MYINDRFVRRLENVQVGSVIFMVRRSGSFGGELSIDDKLYTLKEKINDGKVYICAPYDEPDVRDYFNHGQLCVHAIPSDFFPKPEMATGPCERYIDVGG